MQTDVALRLDFSFVQGHTALTEIKPPFVWVVCTREVIICLIF